MATLKAAIIPVTPLQQNSCVIWKESSKIAAVTDPGGDLSLIENFIAEQVLRFQKYSLLTVIWIMLEELLNYLKSTT